MAAFEAGFLEDDIESSASELSNIGDEVPLGDGSCPPSPLESASFNEPIDSGGGPSGQFAASRGSPRTSTPRRAFRSVVNATVHSQSNEILTELKKVNSRLETFCERLDSLDGRLKTVEDMQVNLSTSVSSSTEECASKTKRKVPSRVSVSSHPSQSSLSLPPILPLSHPTCLNPARVKV